MIFLSMMLLTALVVTLMVVGVRTRVHRQMMAIPSYRRTKRQQESQSSVWLRAWDGWLTSLGLGKTFWLLPVMGAGVGAVVGRVGFHAISVGAIAGVFTPWLVSLWLKHYLEREYLNQVKETMRFMESTFSSGGKMESMLPEMLHRTQGKMRKEVESAVALMKNGTSMRDILIRWNRSTTEPHFAFALRSLADVLKNAGDFVTVMSESITELQRDEQFREALQVVTRSSWTMLLVILAFPVISFALFHKVVAMELHEMPWLIGVLVIGVLAMVGILIWFQRVSRV